MVRFMYRKRSEHRKRIRFFTAITAVFLVLSSCIDDPPTHPEINDYQSYFDMVWELYDQKYVAFDEKNVDWDAVYDEYSQLAGNAGSFDELNDLMIEMVGTLEDKNAFLANWESPYNPSYIPTYSPDIEINYIQQFTEEFVTPWDIRWYSMWGSKWENEVIPNPQGRRSCPRAFPPFQL